MKKLLFFVILFLASTAVFAGGRDKDALAEIGPANVTLTVSTSVVIAAGSSGVYNCLDYVVATSTATFQFYILNGNTTTYYDQIPAGGHIPPIFNPAFCGSAATALTLKTVVLTGGTETSINYKGFKGR